jgi:hypothetical protein
MFHDKYLTAPTAFGHRCSPRHRQSQHPTRCAEGGIYLILGPGPRDQNRRGSINPHLTVQRVNRHLLRISSGLLRHTATSRALTEEALANVVKWCADIQVQSDLRLYEAMDPSRPSSAIPKVPFNIAYDTPLGMWDYHAKDKHLEALFSANVATEFGSAEMSPEHLTMGYSWDKLGSDTVIDVSV